MSERNTEYYRKLRNIEMFARKEHSYIERKKYYEKQVNRCIQ
jgi:hypothetical protein